MTKFFRAKIIQRLLLEVVAGETPKKVVDKISKFFVFFALCRSSKPICFQE